MCVNTSHPLLFLTILQGFVGKGPRNFFIPSYATEMNFSCNVLIDISLPISNSFCVTATNVVEMDSCLFY